MSLNHMYYVYILRGSDDSLYIGVTNDVVRRLNEHNEGADPKAFTYSRRPLLLIYKEVYLSINRAIKREKQLKNWSRDKKESLINGDFDALKKLSKKDF